MEDKGGSKCDAVNGTGGTHNPGPPSACAGGTRGLSGAPRALPGANWRHLVDGAWPHTWPCRSGHISTGPVALNLPPRVSLGLNPNYPHRQHEWGAGNLEPRHPHTK